VGAADAAAGKSPTEATVIATRAHKGRRMRPPGETGDQRTLRR
jgi:hypothetical protein